MIGSTLFLHLPRFALDASSHQVRAAAPKGYIFFDKGSRKRGRKERENRIGTLTILGDCCLRRKPCNMPPRPPLLRTRSMRVTRSIATLIAAVFAACLQAASPAMFSGDTSFQFSVFWGHHMVFRTRLSSLAGRDGRAKKGDEKLSPVWFSGRDRRHARHLCGLGNMGAVASSPPAPLGEPVAGAYGSGSVKASRLGGGGGSRPVRADIPDLVTASIMVILYASRPGRTSSCSSPTTTAMRTPAAMATRSSARRTSTSSRLNRCSSRRRTPARRCVCRRAA